MQPADTCITDCVETSCLKIQPVKCPLPRGWVEGYVAGGEELMFWESLGKSIA